MCDPLGLPLPACNVRVCYDMKKVVLRSAVAVIRFLWRLRQRASVFVAAPTLAYGTPPLFPTALTPLPPSPLPSLCLPPNSAAGSPCLWAAYRGS